MSEWERRVASWEEDGRILEAEIADVRADAQLLRERGHDFPAEVMEHHAAKAEATLAECRARLAEAE